tara:strand:- start:165 stop:404 length:240 start_codon:yes stop_codon:yes gene_type:complete
MLVIEVSINSSYQNSSIPVPYPTGYGEIINAAHDSVTDKMMATVMKPNPWATGLIPNLPQRLLQTSSRAILSFSPWSRK